MIRSSRVGLSEEEEEMGASRSGEECTVLRSPGVVVSAFVDVESASLGAVVEVGEGAAGVEEGALEGAVASVAGAEEVFGSDIMEEL